MGLSKPRYIRCMSDHLVDFNDSNLSVADDRFPMTMVNSRTTRANWFVGIDSATEMTLRANLKPLPPLAPEAPADWRMSRDFPRILSFIVGLAAFSSIGSWFEKWMLWLNCVSIVFLLVEILTRNELLQLGRFDQKTSRRLLLRIFFITLLTGGLTSVFFPRIVSVISSLILLSIMLVIANYDIRNWFHERQSVSSYNRTNQVQRDRRERSITARKQIEKSNSEVNSQLRKLYPERLHYSVMCQVRRELIDQVLLMAFAELGVSQVEQDFVLGDRDRFILEITGPTFGSGKFVSAFPSPIVQFPFELPRQNRHESPAILKFLSHLYLCRVGMVLPSGFGFFEAIVDSVDLLVHPRGHELLLWKAISRVTRLNAGDDSDADRISIQTYGGSETVLPVNGIFITEHLEKVASAGHRVEAEESIQVSNDSDYQVNSFVMAVQQKMVEGA
jgi:hypothetical protein